MLSKKNIYFTKSHCCSFQAIKYTDAYFNLTREIVYFGLLFLRIMVIYLNGLSLCFNTFEVIKSLCPFETFYDTFYCIRRHSSVFKLSNPIK